MISINIPGVPVPWSRASGGKTRKHFTPQRQRSYMDAVRLYAKEAMRGVKPFTGALKVRVEATYQTPKSLNKWAWKTSRPDVDNIAKIAMDSLNGIAWEDDEQISILNVTKMYGAGPRLHITIENLVGKSNG